MIIIPYIFYLYALLLNSINVNDVVTTHIENWGDTGLIPFNNEVLKKKSKAVHGLVVNEMINTKTKPSGLTRFGSCVTPNSATHISQL